jgi:hypothetical protein
MVAPQMTKETEEKILQLRVEQFVRDFAPDDQYDHTTFLEELHVIMRQALLVGSAVVINQLERRMQP